MLSGLSASEQFTAAQTGATSPVLNYVWINEKADEPGKDFLCSVPLHYIDKALENARRFPEARVNIWMDSRYLDESSQCSVQDHIRLSGINNITLCQLESIPRYLETEFFEPQAGHHIYSRVDMARLLVIAHCFETTPANDVFYADFDIHNAGLNDKKVLELLSREGMGFGVANQMLEIGYMVFRREKTLEFLNNTLIPEALKDTATEKIGWHAMIRSLFERKFGEAPVPGHDLRPHAKRLVDSYGALQIEPSRYVLPKNPAYIANGLNKP